MLHKRTTFVFWGVLIAVLWYVTICALGLMTDNDKPHPFLDAIFSFMLFPVSYLPGWGSWNSRSHWMSYDTWSWYANIGLILNCVLWGFCLVWLFRFAGRQFGFRHVEEHENAA